MIIRRAAVSATPEDLDTSSSSLALLPLLSVAVLVSILLFLSFRLFRRSLHLPALTWLRGKGQGAKSRLGLGSVELLPTSSKAISGTSASPYTSSFNLESNTRKDQGASLLSRSSSLDGLPQFVTETSSPPPSTPTRRSKSRTSHFKFPTFLRSPGKSLHRRSRSLGVPVRNLTTPPPPSAFFVTGSSAPSTPSSQPLLIDFSSSSNSSSSTSSDLGAHKFPSSSGPAPLIPGIPIPASSPTRPSNSKSHTFPTSNSRSWAFDDDDAEVAAEFEAMNPLATAFKRISQELPNLGPQSQVDAIPLASPSSSTLVQAQDVPSLAAPQRLSTVNPFASFTPTSATYIAHQPLSPSPIPLSPSLPSDIPLVPLKSAPATLPGEALSSFDTIKDRSTPEPLTLSIAGASPGIHTPPMPSPHEVNSKISPKMPVADVTLDPFNDVHAIIPDLDSNDTHVAPHPLAELPTAEVAMVTTHSQDVESLLQQSPTLTSTLPELMTTTRIVPHTEYEPLGSNWGWDDTWGTISSPELSQTLAELPAPTQPTVAGHEDEVLPPNKVGDLISLDQDRDHLLSVGPAVAYEPVTAPVIDVSRDMDPADTWFAEEPTAVWDTTWVEEEQTKSQPIDEKVQDPGLKVVESGEFVGVQSPDQVTVIHAEPSEVHVKEKFVASIPNEPEELSGSQITLNEINDFHDHDTNDSELNVIDVTITASPAKSLLSTPITPPSPHHHLPPYVATTAPAPTEEEECPDPDLLPLPDLPPLTTPPSPVMLSPQLVKANSPTSPLPLAQTPTPPASPPPVFHAIIRPSSPFRAVNAGSPVITTPAVVADSEIKLAGPEEQDLAVNTSKSYSNGHVDLVTKEDDNAQVVEVDTVHPSDKEPRDSTDRLSADRPVTPPTALSTDLPGSFPLISETATSLSVPAPAHLPLLPRVVASPSKVSPTNDTPTPSTSTSPQSNSQAVQERRVPDSNRLRPPRSALDLALAMQLRPGLGAGADPAWMVRFLMALFGWVAMLASGEIQ